MPKYILSEKQYQKLTETGSNSAAMDLDRYVQPVSYDTDNGNNDLIETIDESIDKLQEISSSMKGGKKINPELKNVIYEISDLISDTCQKIQTSTFTNFNN